MKISQPIFQPLSTNKVLCVRGFVLRRARSEACACLLIDRDRLFRATVNIGGRRACVRAVRLPPKAKLSQYAPHS